MHMDAATPIGVAVVIRRRARNRARAMPMYSALALFLRSVLRS